MNTKEFYYHLPENLIAQTPIKQRTHSKLLVLDKDTGEISHKHFYDIVDFIEEGDCLVLNNTRVIPARLYGTKKVSGGKIEILLLKRIDINTWEVLVKPGRIAKVGAQFEFGEGLLSAEVIDVLEDGNRIVKFYFNGIWEELLDKLGEMPLPPYIKENLNDKERYQTVYSKIEGSAAAPTAGLHFNSELLDKLRLKGAETAFLTLHVGLGTFRPVSVDNVENHKMHSEYYEITQETADKINNAKRNGKKIIAVGTTSVRTLETCADEKGIIYPTSGWTDIFIYPGYKFKITDRIITNFHLPESTLLMLISAFAGKENVMNAYEEAIRNQYRFFSFGDSMFM